jgi:hypothetical protein
VRKALANSRIALETRAFDYALERTVRTLHRRDGRLLHEQRAVIPQPDALFRSESAESLRGAASSGASARPALPSTITRPMRRCC